MRYRSPKRPIFSTRAKHVTGRTREDTTTERRERHPVHQLRVRPETDVSTWFTNGTLRTAPAHAAGTSIMICARAASSSRTRPRTRQYRSPFISYLSRAVPSHTGMGWYILSHSLIFHPIFPFHLLASFSEYETHVQLSTEFSEFADHSSLSCRSVFSVRIPHFCETVRRLDFDKLFSSHHATLFLHRRSHAPTESLSFSTLLNRSRSLQTLYGTFH